LPRRGVARRVARTLHKGKRKVPPRSCTRGRVSLTLAWRAPLPPPPPPPLLPVRCSKFSLQFLPVSADTASRRRPAASAPLVLADWGKVHLMLEDRRRGEREGCDCATAHPIAMIRGHPMPIPVGLADQTGRSRGAVLGVAAVNNAINRSAPMAPNSAEIEIQVAVAAGCIDRRAVSAMAGKGKALALSHMHSLSLSLFFFLLSWDNAFASRQRFDGSKSVAFAQRILSGAR